MTDINRTGSELISKERQKQTAEVFTPGELVHEMNNRVPDEMWTNPTKTFCDPAAGDGNILIAVYKEKLWQGHDAVEALTTIYGVDIMEDNVKNCKRRLMTIAIEAGIESDKDLKRVTRILANNIIWANSLEYDMRFRHKDNRAQTSRLTAKDV